MSTHPNVILKLTIKPAGTTRKLARDILAQNRIEIPDDQLPIMIDNSGKTVTRMDGTPIHQIRDEDGVAIGSRVYRVLVMEGDYDDGYQIAAEEGDLVIFDFMTYGYGESIEFSGLVTAESELRAWSTARGLEFQTSSVTANYW